MTTAACAQSRLVDLHFSLRIAPAEERELRSHLGGCDACRTLYRRHLLLSRLDPRAAPLANRLARALGLAGGRNRKSWLALATAATAIAAAVALWPSAQAEFTARGVPAAPSSVVVYRVSPAGKAQPVGASISRGDELAFAYRNPAAHKYLLVFGVDEHQHVYWYHPAWTDPAQDPQAIAVRGSSELVELPEAISHKLDGRRLSVRAVLLDSPLHVREVEARLARGISPLERGAREESLELEVRP